MQAIGALAVFFRQEFDRDPAFEPRILCQINFAHSAYAEQFFDSEMLNLDIFERTHNFGRFIC
jgi:hypothetical protein